MCAQHVRAAVAALKQRLDEHATSKLRELDSVVTRKLKQLDALSDELLVGQSQLTLGAQFIQHALSARDADINLGTALQSLTGMVTLACTERPSVTRIAWLAVDVELATCMDAMDNYLTVIRPVCGCLAEVCCKRRCVFRLCAVLQSEATPPLQVCTATDGARAKQFLVTTLTSGRIHWPKSEALVAQLVQEYGRDADVMAAFADSVSARAADSDAMQCTLASSSMVQVLIQGLTRFGGNAHVLARTLTAVAALLRPPGLAVDHNADLGVGCDQYLGLIQEIVRAHSANDAVVTAALQAVVPLVRVPALADAMIARGYIEWSVATLQRFTHCVAVQDWQLAAGACEFLRQFLYTEDKIAALYDRGAAQALTAFLAAHSNAEVVSLCAINAISMMFSAVPLTHGGVMAASTPLLMQLIAEESHSADFKFATIVSMLGVQRWQSARTMMRAAGAAAKVRRVMRAHRADADIQDFG